MSLTSGSTDHNTQIALRLIELLDRHELDAAEDLMGPDLQLHDVWAREDARAG
jgi:hypothetical protein